jgi:hypothetical protein
MGNQREENAMRSVLAAATITMAMTGSAWGQTSWSTDQFTVSTDNMTLVNIVGESVQVAWLPIAVSNPASNSSWPSTQLDLSFAPQPGYRLAGELVNFAVDMAVDAYSAPTDLLLNALGSFNVDINGEYTLSGTDTGGSAHRTGSYLLRNPNLVSVLDEATVEGIACPLGDDHDGCNFGLDWVFLQAEVDFTSFTVTPLLSPVPEPRPRLQWLASLGLASIVLARRRAAQRFRLLRLPMIA